MAHLNLTKWIKIEESGQNDSINALVHFHVHLNYAEYSFRHVSHVAPPVT